MEKIQKIEELTSDLEKKTRDLTLAEERLTMIEAKTMDKQLRMKRSPEEKGENIYKKILAILAEFMDEKDGAFEDELDWV